LLGWVAVSFTLFVLLASPARADHQCTPDNKPDCDNTAGVIGTAAGIATTIAVVSALIKKRKPDAKDTDVCKELEAQYARVYEKWRGEYAKAKQTMPMVQKARAGLQQAEASRVTLIEQQQGAVGYMLGAGGAAGTVVGSMAAAFCGAMSAYWAGATSMVEASTAVDVAMAGGNAEAIAAAEEAWMTAHELAMANADKPAYWSGAAGRMFKEVLGAGAAAGAAAGKILEDQMDKGMKEVNDSVARLQKIVQGFEQSASILAHDANRSRKELLELASRIERECGVEMKQPEEGEIWTPGSGG
jgi:hypothetical protein